MSEPVRYRVSLKRPHSHLLEVEARFPATAGPLIAKLPVWTPGSYLVREYARHIQDVSAVNDESRALQVERLDKQSFRVDNQGNPVTLRYRVYAHELTVRTSHFDGSHAYFNGATLFLYADAFRQRHHRIEVVDVPTGWKTFVALPTDGKAFIARDYDEVVDSPFEVGPHTPVDFTAAGVSHQLVIWGETSINPQRWVEDLTRVVETEAALFGGLPLERYLFLVYLTDKGRGGLEHKASTALLYPGSALTSPKGWEDFLTLVSHEYFHLWNIKRVKPKAFVPFDYGQEAYTRLLWAFEGTTSYYDNLLVRRAGLMSGARYLTRLGETLTALQGAPGRKVLPLAEASFLAWIKHYRPDENFANSAISYYLKGEVVAALLDLELRRRSGDKKSLDDVMRLLWKRYGDEQGVPEDGVEVAVKEVAGEDLTPFFDRAIRGTDELDLSPFAHVGLEPRFRVRESTSDKGGTPPRITKGQDTKPRGWLGISVRGSSTVSVVFEGTPAMEAGLYPDDEIVALDGQKVDGAGLLSRIEDFQPGEAHRVTVFRRDRLTEVPVTLGEKPSDAVYLARVDAPSEAQKAAYQAWLGEAWEGAAEPAPS